jgi:hypothetical protein
MVDVQLLSDYQRVIVNNWDDHRNILGLNEVRKPTITNHAIVRVQPKKCGRDQGNPMEKKTGRHQQRTDLLWGGYLVVPVMEISIVEPMGIAWNCGVSLKY